jgi:hypothetical protein
MINNNLKGEFLESMIDTSPLKWLRMNSPQTRWLRDKGSAAGEELKDINVTIEDSAFVGKANKARRVISTRKKWVKSPSGPAR